MKNTNIDPGLAPSITKAASEQTYYTIRYLVDSDRVADAYRAYAYFRWVDDSLDAASGPALSGATNGSADEASARTAFIERQHSLLEKCYRGVPARDADIHESLLVDLISKDHEKNSGLQCYLRNMMGVMDFDVKRRGQSVSHVELNEYTRLLASAVTEAMHYFIGHCCYSPHNEARRTYYAHAARYVRRCAGGILQHPARSAGRESYLAARYSM
jgi:hypothetical protein